jgi:hypothetical protein
MNATLCTTNNTEPWAANVNFEINGANLSTTLKIKYAHYSNLKTNNHVVIVYQGKDHELIIKALATVVEVSKEEAKVLFEATWLRLVKAGKVSDFKEESDILFALNSLNQA